MLILLTLSRIAFPDLPPSVRARVKWHAKDMRAKLVWHANPDAGIIEYALDGVLEGIGHALGTMDRPPHILRLDDDEWASPPLLRWLRDRSYLTHDHWKFPRMHRYGADGRQWIAAPPLWPDHQTRLSILAKAGGRTRIHAGSPFGGGETCAHPIVHDKFLKPIGEREQIAATYDSILPGAGLGSFAPFNVPERVWSAEELAARLRPFPWSDPT